MKKFLTLNVLISTLALILVLLVVVSAHAATPDIKLCDGNYALCAASTCKLTGGTITTNDGKTYPEVACTCPVLKGKAIADLTGGNMKGSCAAPDKEHVWSLFAPKFHYPQEANNFVAEPKSATRVKVQNCGAANALKSTNCFSMLCTYSKPINGTPVATCKCPIGQIAQGSDFLTEAGQGDPAACDQHPVAAPNPF